MIKILFVLRGYNDIDHIVPLLDFLLSDKKDLCEFKVYFAKHETVDLEANENIRYLRQHYGQKFYVFSPAWALSFFRWLDSFEEKTIELMRFVKGINRYCVKAVSIIERFGVKFLSLVRSRLLQRYIAKEVSSFAPDIVCFDFVGLHLFPYKQILLVARGMNVPLIGLPHGLNVFSEMMDANRRRRETLLRVDSKLNFDFQFAPNSLHKQHLVDEGFPAERILALGAARYERRWLEKKEKYFPRRNIDLDLGLDGFRCPKIVVFPNKLMYRGNADAVKEIIHTCLQFGQVIVKPHTRNMDIGFIRESSLVKKCRIVGNETNSSDLIYWCDIAVFWGSSIGIQVITQNKKFINAQFAHNYSTIFDTSFELATAQNAVAFEKILSDMVCNPASRLYSADDIDEFLQQFVYVSNEQCNVAARYFDEFERIVFSRR